jgi:two-component system chemotaxis sensor kinase CheA
MTAASNIRNEFAGLQNDWDGASRYLPIFIDESLETIEELTKALLALEAGGEQKHVKQLFVAAHRIKGSAASIGLNRVAKLAHLMEDLLQSLLNNDDPLAPPMADGLLACTDGLRNYIHALRGGRPEEDDFDHLAQQLLTSRSAAANPVPASPQHGEQTRPQNDAIPAHPSNAPPRC